MRDADTAGKRANHGQADGGLFRAPRGTLLSERIDVPGKTQELSRIQSSLARE